MHNNERVIIYQYHEDSGHHPRASTNTPSFLWAVGVCEDHSECEVRVPSLVQLILFLNRLEAAHGLVLVRLISIPIRLSGKNSPNLRNKGVAPVSVLAVFLLLHSRELGLQRVWGQWGLSLRSFILFKLLAV